MVASRTRHTQDRAIRNAVSALSSEFTPTPRRRRSGSRAAPLFFFAGGCLLVILSIVVFAAAFLLRSNDASDAFAWNTPMELVDPRALTPDTVFLALTSVSANEALSRALDGGHWENAYAMVAYDTRLSFTTRLGALLQLAPRYAASKDTRKAVWCYQAAAQLATLAPELSDAARLDAYAQANAGLRELNAREVARWVTDQAYLVAQYSPYLQRDLRARRLTQIADAYTALGATPLSAQARLKAREAASATGESATVQVETVFNAPSGQLPSAPQLDAVIKARLDATQLLQDDVLDAKFKTMSAVPKDWLTPLGDLLDEEDRVREDYYAAQLAAAKDEGVRVALLREKRNWLALKLRAARGGFGIGLTPAWEKDARAIAVALSETHAELYQLSEAQAAKQKESVQALDDTLRRELYTARWGWFTSVAEKDVWLALDDNNQRLRESAPTELVLDQVARGTRVLYWLVPSELYGQGERARPR